MRKSVKAIGVLAGTLIVFASGAWAQTPDKGPTFEVASIKPADPAAGGNMSVNMGGGGRVIMTNVTVHWLITQAWKIHDYQLTGEPHWFETEHFDIAAKPETATPPTPEGQKTLRRMMQNLVVDRFGLIYHRETRQLPMYALVVAKNGPKLAPSTTATELGGWSSGNGKLEGKAMKTAEIAEALSESAGTTVMDQTGLTGEYDYTLKWTPDLENGTPSEAAGAQGPSLFTAIQEQLGLKLESRKGPVEIIVIDKAERPSAN
jgi:uncharacterized protein (TIGR03435 family)